jgi:phosphoglycolate phosphatase-like HAD superfamily hydrolase
MNEPGMRLALFDVDGTLILTGGAGMRAFYRALQQVFGLMVTSEVIRPDGKTDPLIAREMLRHFERESLWNEQSGQELFQCYIGCLDEEMARACAAEAVRVLPGVEQLLSALARLPGFALGLVTGNVEAGARIKLERAGLHRYFSFGGYGSDAEDRTALIRIGMERGARAVAPAPVRASFVIGDTPLDVHHGRAAGACVIAVASARYSMADLAACDPDLLVPDLTGTAHIISFMKSW